MRRRPRYPNHVSQKLDLRLDAWSYLYNDGGRFRYVISDRRSPRIRGEDPRIRISLVKEKNRPIQLRLACKGVFHVEQILYATIPPEQWVERVWLIFPWDSVLQLRSFLHHFKIQSNSVTNV